MVRLLVVAVLFALREEDSGDCCWDACDADGLRDGVGSDGRGADTSTPGTVRDASALRTAAILSW